MMAFEVWARDGKVGCPRAIVMTSSNTIFVFNFV